MSVHVDPKTLLFRDLSPTLWADLREYVEGGILKGQLVSGSIHVDTLLDEWFEVTGIGTNPALQAAAKVGTLPALILCSYIHAKESGCLTLSSSEVPPLLKERLPGLTFVWEPVLLAFVAPTLIPELSVILEYCDSMWRISIGTDWAHISNTIEACIDAYVKWAQEAVNVFLGPEYSS